MSADLFVWDPTIELHPLSIHFIDELEQLEMADPRSPPTPTICKFVTALVLRYPDLGSQSDAYTIWSFGPLLSGASGGSINLTMTMEGYGLGGEFILETAQRFGLDVFDPQGNEVHFHNGEIAQRPPGLS